MSGSPIEKGEPVTEREQQRLLVAGDPFVGADLPSETWLKEWQVE